MDIKNNIYIFFLITLLYFFFIYKANFGGPDQPIYFAYTASVVEDGDLNVVNQVYNNAGQFSVSQTYNLADFHSHGGVVLWAPLYIYGKIIYLIVKKFNLFNATGFNLEQFTKCVLSFSTLIFGFLTLLFTYKFCKVFFKKSISVWSTIAVFLGTPLFYYLTRETGSANIIACLFSIFSIWFCTYIIDMKKSHWFLYGLFFSICLTVKIDLWFQALFISLIFITLVILKQTTWKSGIYFLIGIIPGLVLKVINDYIKYGTFHAGEFSGINFRDSYLFEQLFSSYRGFFYTSPILYICALGVVFLIINLMKNNKVITREEKLQSLFLLIVSSYLVFKIILLGFRYAWGGGTCGARPLLTEFPIFVLLYAYILNKQRGSLKVFFIIISLSFIFWNMFVISEFIARVDLSYVKKMPPLYARIRTFHNLNQIFYIRDVRLKLLSCLPLLFVVSGIIFFIIERFKEPADSAFWYFRNLNSNNRNFRAFVLFTLYLFISYTAITFVNIYNNRRNVEKLKSDGFFENAKFIGPGEFEKGENIGSMNEMMRYFELKGNKDRVNKIKRYKKEIYGEDG